MPLHLVSVDEHSPAQRLGLEPGCINAARIATSVFP